MKAKIRFVIIGFIILIIPIGYLMVRGYAINIQKEAIDLNRIGYFDKAIEKIDHAIYLAPRNYLFYATKAQFLESQEKYHEAINEFEKIFKFKDNYAEGFVSVGMNYERLGMLDSASVAYKSALDSYNYRIEEYEGDKEKLYGEKINKGFVYLLLADSINAKLEFAQIKKDYPENSVFIEDFELMDVKKFILKNK